jgi:polar amino acid transport system substrate-binding protein
MRCLLSAAVIATSQLLAAPICSAQEVIHVVYGERPPYVTALSDGSPAGLTGAPTAAAFKAAGIAVQWQQVPTNRQLFMVKDAHSQICAVGWFNSPERHEYAKFTKPIYRDHNWVIVTNAAFAARGIGSLDELTQVRDARVLLKDNYSYGGLNPYLKQWQPVMAVSTATTLRMVQSVSKGAVDLMFVSEEEGAYIMQHHNGQANNLRLLQFKDLPRGEERYIMCSKAVPDDIINRLNKAITFK